MSEQLRDAELEIIQRYGLPFNTSREELNEIAVAEREAQNAYFSQF